MNTTAIATRSVVIEREFPYPPAKIWRALTQPHLIAEWLMKNDFEPQVGRTFRLTADWGAVECRVEQIEPERTLSYTWTTMGFETTVTWTLTATADGTNLRMEHAGFAADREQAYRGAQNGWPRFFGSLESVLARD
jgi:uncharacterized protein YndB with AHSA1/START domain